MKRAAFWLFVLSLFVIPYWGLFWAAVGFAILFVYAFFIWPIRVISWFVSDDMDDVPRNPMGL